MTFISYCCNYLIPWNVPSPSKVAILWSTLSPTKVMNCPQMHVIEEYLQYSPSWPLPVWNEQLHLMILRIQDWPVEYWAILMQTYDRTRHPRSPKVKENHNILCFELFVHLITKALYKFITATWKCYKCYMCRGIIGLKSHVNIF